MLDEEVEFEISRKQERPLLNKIESAIEIPVHLAAGIGSFFFTKEIMEFSTFWSFVIGSPAGVAVSALTWHKLENILDHILDKKYSNQEERIDQIAVEKGAPTISFNYRGNTLDCVIRPEYKENGNIFYMKNNDGFLYNILLSYQPERTNKLTFGFTVPRFKPNLSAKRDSFKRRLDDLSGTKQPKEITEEELEKGYTATMKKVIENTHLSCKFTYDNNGNIITYLISTGTKPEDNFGEISRTAHQAMNAARKYCSESNAKIMQSNRKYRNK